MRQDLQQYGGIVHADQLIRLMEHQFAVNQKAYRRGKPGVPFCIWGAHGIGKTQIVLDFAKSRSWKLVHLAPAQFEEMGDLLGMPAVRGEQTVFRPPSWAPSDAGPGILLLDDFNRADDRIIRGLMPLLERGRLISWGLPIDWQIVLTANPDTGDYSVTPLDLAVITRMMHVRLSFDLSSWVDWAESRKIHSFLIDFVVLHPELINTNRTTPRTLVQFFESLQQLPDWPRQRSLVQLLGLATLDEAAIAAFLPYLRSTEKGLPAGQTILETDEFDAEIKEPLENWYRKSGQRIDILAVTGRRLIRRLQLRSGRLNYQELENLRAFLRLEVLPKDLVGIWIEQLLELSRPELQELFADPEWAAFL